MRGMPPIPKAAKPQAVLATGLCAVALMLAGCQPDRPSTDDASGAPGEAVMDAAASDPAAEGAGEPKKSIIRPDIETTLPEPVRLEPVELTVPFPEKGTRLDEAGLAALDGFLARPILAAGGPITIWGHSDSRGSDKDNRAASGRRAQAVKDYFEKKGIAPDRITVVALGEGRPIAPNRKLDGSDDPEGQAKNRRVEIKVDLPRPGPEPAGDKPAAEAKR